MGMGLNLQVIEAIYTCSYCGATFGSQEELDTHIRTVHIAGIPEWLGKYWPALALGAVAISILGFAIFKKKEGK